MSELGELRLEIVEGDEARSAMELGRTWRNGRFPGDPLQVEPTASFYGEVAARKGGLCRTFRLVVGGRPIAMLFGLIHGAGFSSHLTDLLKATLGAGEIWSPLLGFNAGIEIGQLVVITLLFPLLWWMRRAGNEGALVPEISRVIAAIGGMLMVGRIFGLFEG